MSSNPTRNIIEAIITNPNFSEEEKSELVEDFINEIKKEYPDLKYHSTKEDLKNIELKLTKEIEQVRKEIKEVDLRLTKEVKSVELRLSKEIEQVRKEIKEVEAKLTKEIEQIRKEIKEVELKLENKIENVKFTMLKWQFIFWLSQMGAFILLVYKLIK